MLFCWFDYVLPLFLFLFLLLSHVPKSCTLQHAYWAFECLSLGIEWINGGTISLSHKPKKFNRWFSRPNSDAFLQAWVSLKRVEAYIFSDDIEATCQGPDDQTVVKLEHAHFVWHKTKQESFELSDLSFSIHAGDFVCVVGPVGSGKSSLLAALLGELQMLSGQMSISEKYSTQGIGFATQEPWIQNTSIQANILCAAPYDAERYAKVWLRDLSNLTYSYLYHVFPTFSFLPCRSWSAAAW